MLDLAPDIHRQRLVIEGIPSRPVTAEDACKPFGNDDAIAFTSKFFEADVVQSRAF